MTGADPKTHYAPELAEALHPEVMALVDEALHAVSRPRPGGRRALAPELEHVRLGPAAAHAWAWRLGRGEHHREAALEEIDQYLLRRGDPGPPRAMRERLTGERGWGQREAIEAGSSLAWALHGLAPGLDAERTAQLTGLVLGTYARLAPTGWRAHYINGNYMLPRCELAWAVDRLTPPAHRYDESFTLLERPGTVRRRFEGYGWIGDDTVGHYSETPGYQGRRPSSTFDPEYTQLQADRLARLWLLTRDPRALHRLDAVHRRIRPLLDESAWQIDSTAGSRTNHRDTFSNSGTVTLAVHAGTVPAEFAQAQFRQAVATDYRNVMHDPHPYHLRGFGWTLLSLMLATAPAEVLDEAFWDQDGLRTDRLDRVRRR